MQAIPLISAAVGVAQSAAAFAYYSVRAIRDPTDGDAVAAVGELSSLDALEGMKRSMMEDRTGRALLKNQPLVTDDVLEYALTLPEDTFGQRYAAYMTHNKFTPSGRTPVHHIADPTLDYVMTRYRQCHDFLHSCTGCGRTVEEELAVKMLEWFHTGLPLGLLAIPGGALHLTAHQRSSMPLYWKWAEANKPCCVHGERQVPFYLNIMWEDLLAKSLAEVRTITGLIPLAEYLTEHTSSQRAASPR